MAISFAPFASLASPLPSITSNARIALLNAIQSIKDLIPTAVSSEAGGVAVQYSPDFDEMRPAIAARLQVELEALRNLVSQASVTL